MKHDSHPSNDLPEAASLPAPRIGSTRDLLPLLPSYALYCLNHLLLSPILSLRGWLRARKRGYNGLIGTRLRGGKAPQRTETLIFSTNLGETRTALLAAEQFLTAGETNFALLVSTQETYALATARPQPFRVDFAPFNNPLSCLLTLYRWRPRRLLFTELTDNSHILMMAAFCGVRTVFYNVHVSEADTQRTQKRVFGGWRYRSVDLFYVQGAIFQERMIRMGVSPERVRVLGPALSIPAFEAEERERVRAKWSALLGLLPETPVFIAGSTYPAEERLLLEAFACVREKLPDSILVLAPRNPNRPEEDNRAMLESGLPFCRRSELEADAPRTPPVVLLDTFGELREIFSVATVAFVGGSLIPDIGGHNLLEALAWGTPITIGPYFDQQRVVVETLEQAGIVVVCPSVARLADCWQTLHRDRERRHQISAAAERAIMQYSDVFQRMYAELKQGL
jgi:3-deoxy-D-manno-octulosonic-acid transferase